MFLLEGTIGAGKSTFLRLLKEALPEMHISLEPLQSWDGAQENGSLLGNFYTDPHRWAYTLETITMVTRFKEQVRLQTTATELTIVERSLFSGHYVFACNSYAQGLLSELEWQLYSQWFNFIITQSKAPLGFIYLRVEPKIAFERIQKRARNAEHGLPFSYLEQICDAHDNFLIEKKNILPMLTNVPVITIDCSEDFEDNTALFQKHLDRIKNFFRKECT